MAGDPPLGDGPFYAIEEIVVDGVLAYPIGTEVPKDVAEANRDSIIEDPPPLEPVRTKPIQVHDDTTGLIVGDTLEGRVKVKAGTAE